MEIIFLIALTLIMMVELITKMINSVWGVLGIIIGPLIGALVGVYLGFGINNNQRKELEKTKKLFFKDLLIHEINKSIDLLNKREASLIPAVVPISGWDSLINSGNIALFKEQSIEMSDIYSEIRKYNYITKRIAEEVERDVFGLARAPEEIPLYPTFKGDLDEAAKNLIGKFKELKRQLETIS